MGVVTELLFADDVVIVEERFWECMIEPKLESLSPFLCSTS